MPLAELEPLPAGLESAAVSAPPLFTLAQPSGAPAVTSLICRPTGVERGSVDELSLDQLYTENSCNQQRSSRSYMSTKVVTRTPDGNIQQILIA